MPPDRVPVRDGPTEKLLSGKLRSFIDYAELYGKLPLDGAAIVELWGASKVGIASGDGVKHIFV
jgi:hypothetical protein